MSDKALRSKVIRLAHEKPELRDHLLPLVTKTAKSDQYSLMSWKSWWWDEFGTIVEKEMNRIYPKSVKHIKSTEDSVLFEMTYSSNGKKEICGLKDSGEKEFQLIIGNQLSSSTISRDKPANKIVENMIGLYKFLNKHQIKS